MYHHNFKKNVSVLKECAQTWKYRKRNIREKNKLWLPIQVLERFFTRDLKYYNPLVEVIFLADKTFQTPLAEDHFLRKTDSGCFEYNMWFPMQICLKERNAYVMLMLLQQSMWLLGFLFKDNRALHLRFCGFS